MMKKKFIHRRKSQSGNIFFMLFASVALVGAFGVGASNVMKGLVSSMSDVTRKTIAEEKMMSGGRLAIQSATTAVDAGDCDADGFVEPLPFVTTTGPHPAGGGMLPANIGATEKDPWGTPYGYCAWDPGPAAGAAGCGVGANRLGGVGTSVDTTVVAVISAGKDRKFSTTCNPGTSGVQDCTGLGEASMNDPASGHCYFKVTSTQLNYPDAQAQCAADGGYLLVLNSQVEADLLWNAGFSSDDMYWLGISDEDVEGQWVYEFGEQAGVNFWNGASAGNGGVAVPGTYNAWYAPGPEPEGGASENVAALNLFGRGNNWTDLPATVGWVSSYICEKGGTNGTAVTRASGSDDIVIEYTYNDANGLSGDDLWRVQDTKPDTAMIQKDIEIAGDASMDGVLELRNRGLLLPNDTETGACTALNESELRINTTASPPILEICYDTVWEPISMGASGGGAAGECGVNWQLEPGGLSGSWIGADVAYGNGIYVAVGGSGIQTSPDGETWTSRTKPAGTMEPSGIVFGNGRFVATATNNGTWSTMTSTDGINWTAGNSTQSGVNNIAYGANMYVAVGWTGFIISSPDGTNWTQRSSTGDDWRDIIYADGKFVAIGAPPSGNVATSTDGVTWTIQAGSGTPYSRLAYGENLYVGTANSGMAYSSNGLSWSGSGVGSGDWNRVIYTTTGRFVAIHFNSGEIAFSDDGMAWTVETGLLDNTKMWGGLIEGNDKLIATALDGTIYSSYCDSQPLVDAEEPEIILPDPVVHLKLDEQTGTNVVDRMNRVTATLSGATSPPSVTGQIGRAYDFDGVDDRITIATNSAVNSLTQFTYSTWIYGITSGAVQYILDSRDGGSRGLRMIKTDNPNRRFQFEAGTGGLWRSAVEIPNNTWTHVAVTYDGSSTANIPIMYLNGVAVAIETATQPSAPYVLPTANTIIGRTYGGTFPQFGYLDDFRIYGQILSPEQITLLYNDRSTNAYVAPNPVAIVAASKYRGKISTGGDATCAIKDDGSAWCWGYGAQGNLGNGAASNAVSPVRVAPPSVSPENAFTQISVGAMLSGSSDHSCGIKADRTMMCWGADDFGQLGNGAATTTDQANPVVVSGSQLWTQVSAGAEHTCAIDTTGALWCWGRDNYGQLGNGAAGGVQASPSAVTDAGPWVSVSAGTNSTCAIKNDGSLWCWGTQLSGRLGNGLSVAGNILDPAPVLETGPWVKVARADTHMCGVKLDGTLWCWGQSATGKLGLGGGLSGDYPKPRRVADPGPWLEVEVSQGDHSCGIKYDGTAWCWGSDVSEKLGNGSLNTNQTTPVRVLDPGPWASLTLGTDTTCGLKADGSAWCWGRDTSGQLGNGSVLTGNQTTPTRVENFPNVAPFSFNSAQTLLTKNAAATTISLGQDGGRIGFDGNSGGFGFTGSGRSILANPNGNSGLSLEAMGAYDSQISWKTVTGATTRSIGVDNVTGNLEFGNNIAAVTNFMSAITPQMVINSSGQVGVGTATPSVKLDVSGGGIRIGNDTRTCTISRRGVLRYNGTVMQFCNGTAWTGF